MLDERNDTAWEHVIGYEQWCMRCRSVTPSLYYYTLQDVPEPRDGEDDRIWEEYFNGMARQVSGSIGNTSGSGLWIPVQVPDDSGNIDTSDDVMAVDPDDH